MPRTDTRNVPIANTCVPRTETGSVHIANTHECPVQTLEEISCC